MPRKKLYGYPSLSNGVRKVPSTNASLTSGTSMLMLTGFGGRQLPDVRTAHERLFVIGREPRERSGVVRAHGDDPGDLRPRGFGLPPIVDSLRSRNVVPAVLHDVVDGTAHDASGFIHVIQVVSKCLNVRNRLGAERSRRVGDDSQLDGALAPMIDRPVRASIQRGQVGRNDRALYDVTVGRDVEERLTRSNAGCGDYEDADDTSANSHWKVPPMPMPATAGPT